MMIGNLFNVDVDLTNERRLVYQGPVHVLAKKEGYELRVNPTYDCPDGTDWVYQDSAHQKLNYSHLAFSIPSCLELLSEKGLSDGWKFLSARENIYSLSFDEYNQEDVIERYTSGDRIKCSSSKGALQMNLQAVIYGPKKYSGEIDLLSISPGRMNGTSLFGNYDFSRKFLFVQFTYLLGKMKCDKERLLPTVFEILGDLRGIVNSDFAAVGYSGHKIVGLKTSVQSQKEWALDHFVETLDRIVADSTFATVLPEKWRLGQIEAANYYYGYKKDSSFSVPEVLSSITDPLNGKVPHTFEEFKAQLVWHYYRPALERMREVVEKDEDMKKFISLI